ILYERTLSEGQWQLWVYAEEISADSPVYQDIEPFVVHPVADYYNFLIAFGALIGIGSAGAAIISLFLQRSNSRNTLKEMKLQRESSISELKAQNQLTEQQIGLLRDQMDKTLRPWIGRVDFIFEGVIWEDGAFTSLDDFEKEKPDKIRSGIGTTKHRHIFWIENYGQVPATNCVSSYTVLTFTGTPDKYEYPQATELDKLKVFSQPITVMPKEKVPLRFDIPTANLENRVVICRIKYEFPTGKGLYDLMIRHTEKGWKPVYNRAE
ncbi:MAG TPA: hypothetical protein VJP79_03055, partial [Nitrososphaera sp.]|nr:hypothetical protein [Nitrososphaera sp.]